MTSRSWSGRRPTRSPHVGGVGVPVDGVPAVLPHQVAQRLDVDHRVPPGPQRVDRPTVRHGEQPGAEPLRRGSYSAALRHTSRKVRCSTSSASSTPT